jgi:uncharacterized protein (UPF0371 family)
MKRGFDAKKYIDAQTKEINKRIQKFKRMYLEIGGKLISDNHAARVLPGYRKSTKIDLMKKLAPLNILYCINAKDLESTRTLSTKNRTYQEQAIKNIKDIQKNKLKISHIVITRYSGEKKAIAFKKQLQAKGHKVSFHKEIKGYSINIPKTLKGFKNQPYIKLKENLTIITGPAGNSGKMAVALSQIYHETKKKKQTGFAKYETFPIHNLPLSHPINIAYEAATADLQDINRIDPYHKKAYKKNSTNYNRDIENFRILRQILRKITKKQNPFGYKSPTDMGINTAKQGIINDKICRKAAIKEIKSRNRRYTSEYKKDRETIKTVERMKQLIKKI